MARTVKKTKEKSIQKNFKSKSVAVEKLKEHPRNYREHPDDQLEHIISSIKSHGFYRNIVVAKDNTILAGHGVVKAAKKMGLTHVPIIQLDIAFDSPQAMKVLIGDNEISHLGEIDDRALSEILKEIMDVDLDGLVGTGYDEMMLANLVFVTRPSSEIENSDSAKEWVGMPEYEESGDLIKVIVSFVCAEDREVFLKKLDVKTVHGRLGKTWSIWFPEKNKDDLSSVQFEGE